MVSTAVFNAPGFEAALRRFVRAVQNFSAITGRGDLNLGSDHPVRF